jgi:pimeloyl-ACP methyl ester carboxylesterase
VSLSQRGLARSTVRVRVPVDAQSRRSQLTRATPALPAATDRPGEHVRHVEDRPRERRQRDAAVLAAVQRPAAPAQFTEPSGPPAWRTIPSWSLIGTQDRVIPAPLQEEMSGRAGAHISRVKAGHLTPITRPADVTKVILSAVDATT